MFSRRRLSYQMRRVLRALGKATGTSHQIALGVAIGFFVAWLPIIGIQMVVSVALCQIFRANKVVPIFPVWLTNPATMVPIYSFNYWVGWLVVGGPPLSAIVIILMKMIEIPAGAEDMGRLEAWWNGIKHAFGELLSMGWDMLLPLCLGSAIIGLALAVPSYYLTRKFVDSFRDALQKKKQINRERRRRQRINPEILLADKGLRSRDPLDRDGLGK